MDWDWPGMVGPLKTIRLDCLVSPVHLARPSLTWADNRSDQVRIGNKPSLAEEFHLRQLCSAHIMQQMILCATKLTICSLQSSPRTGLRIPLDWNWPDLTSPSTHTGLDWLADPDTWLGLA
jgi:hypothetical protein